MEKLTKYIEFTYNGGAKTVLKYSDYLKNKDYFDKLLVQKRVFNAA